MNYERFWNVSKQKNKKKKKEKFDLKEKIYFI